MFSPFGQSPKSADHKIHLRSPVNRWPFAVSRAAKPLTHVRLRTLLRNSCKLADEKQVVIHTDHKLQAPYDHLSEEAIDEHCMNGSTGSVAQDAHLAACLECTQRTTENREFLRIFKHAAEASPVAEGQRLRSLSALGGIGLAQGELRLDLTSHGLARLLVVMFRHASVPPGHFTLRLRILLNP